jgi:hypothetical protein
MQELMSVAALLLNPANGRVFGTIVQNGIIGLHLLSRAESVSRADACQLIMAADVSPKQTLPPSISGRALLSMLLPDLVSVRAGDLLVVDGVLVEGLVRKNNVSSLVHAIAKDVSSQAAVDFCTAASALADAYLGIQGSSFCFEELYREEEQEAFQGQLRELEGVRMRADGTPEMVQRLRDFMLDSGAVVRKRLESGPSTVADMMVHSGAKGSALNLSMFAGVQGPAEVSGSLQFLEKPLVCFARNTDTPQSVGFVGNNFMRGLNPVEMFTSAGPARQQMADQSIYTGTCGHLFRKIVHLMEDLHLGWGGCVLTFNGQMVQRNYGGDGLLPERTEIVGVEPPSLSEGREWYVACCRALLCCWLPSDRPLRLSAPFDPHRWLLGGKFFRVPGPPAPASTYIQYLRAMDCRLRRAYGTASRHVRAVMWLVFRPSTALSAPTLNNMLRFALASFDVSVAPGGLTVGISAATAVCAPITQWSLNSVHASSAGSASSSNSISNLRLTVEGSLAQPCALTARTTFRDPASLAHTLMKAEWRLTRVPVRPTDLTRLLLPTTVFRAAYRVYATGGAALWNIAQRLRVKCAWWVQWRGEDMELLLSRDVSPPQPGLSGVFRSVSLCSGNIVVDRGTWTDVPSVLRYVDASTLACTNAASTLRVLGVEAAVITTARKLLDLIRVQGESYLLGRHICLIARRMGKCGGILHGANPRGVSQGPPLTAGKFEKVVTSLVDSALKGKKESPLMSLAGIVLTGGRGSSYTELLMPSPLPARVPSSLPIWTPQSPGLRLPSPPPDWDPGSPTVVAGQDGDVSTCADF